MTNMEKRGQELLDFIAENGHTPAIRQGKFCQCSEIECTECDLNTNSMSCRVRFKLWLKSEYEDIPHGTAIDTPILVWNNGSDVKRREYFAGFYEDGKVCAWANGATSWSAYGEWRKWDHAELACL